MSNADGEFIHTASPVVRQAIERLEQESPLYREAEQMGLTRLRAFLVEREVANTEQLS